MKPASEHYDSLHEADLLVLHQEVDSITALTTAKAFEYPFGGGNYKGRSLFIVEGALANIVDTAPFQIYIIGYDFCNLALGLLYDAFYYGLVNHIFPLLFQR